MQGGVESAVEQLAKKASDTTSRLPLIDQVALLTLKAEILFLDSKEQDSLEVFKKEIEGKLDQLASEVALIVSYNRNFVTRSMRALARPASPSAPSASISRPRIWKDRSTSPNRTPSIWSSSGRKTRWRWAWAT